MRKTMMASMLLTLAGALPTSALERRVWTARYPLPPEGWVTLENVQGDIQVEAWNRSQIEVTVTKTAMSAESRLDDVRIAFQLGNGGLGIRTVYMGESGEPVRVDYRLRVPRAAHLNELRTVQGDITVRNIEGPIDARTLYGNIEQSDVAGRVVARAINGNVAVSLRDLPRVSAPLVLDTVNGNLDLLLPAGANANLELSTVAGKIASGYIFVVGGTPGDSTRRALLGRGGPVVRLRTVRGDIRVSERED